MSNDKTPATLAVDVRSVWAEMSDSIANRRDECLERGQFIQAELYREMLAKHDRATVAVDELIEAIDKLFGADMERCMEMDGKEDQLEAVQFAKSALARVKGESA